MATDLELLRRLRADAAAILERAEAVAAMLPDDIRAAALAARIETLRRTIREYDEALDEIRK